MHWEAEVEETEATRSPAGVGRIIAIAVIALGAVLMLAGAWSRARFQQKSLSE